MHHVPPLRRTARALAPFAPLLLLLAACGGDPSAPDTAGSRPEDAAPLSSASPDESFRITPGDADWYRIDPTRASLLDVTLTVDDEARLAGALLLPPLAASTDVHVSSGVATAWQAAADGYVPPGETAWLVVTGEGDEELTGSHGESGAYRIAHRLTEVPDADLEPNDRPDQATPAAPGDVVDLFVGEPDTEEDWVALRLERASIVEVALTAEGEYSELEGRLYRDGEAVGGFLDDGRGPGLATTLPAGVHLFRFRGRIDADEGFGAGRGSYRASFAATAVPDADLEPNDAPGQATPLALGSETPFFKGLDPDWYEIRLAEGAHVRVTVLGPEGEDLESGPSGRSYDLVLRLEGEDGAPLRQTETSPHHQDGVEASLPAGLYRLRVTGGIHDDEDAFPVGGAYRLRVETSPILDGDIEPNDRPGQATPITVPFERDLTTAENDPDLFELTLAQRSMIEVQSAWDGYNDMEAEVEGSDGSTVLWASLFGEGGAGMKVQVLEPGTYRILSRGVVGGTFHHRLRIDAWPVPDLAYEPNESRDDAWTIEGSSLEAELVVSRGDRDVFRFTLDRESEVRASAETPDGFVDLTIAHPAASAVYSLDHPYVQTLPAGEYFIEAFSHFDAQRVVLSLEIAPR